MNQLDERILDQYLLLIDAKLSEVRCKDWSCLTDDERTTLTAYFFALDVTNGGLEKFFLEHGDRCRETLRAINTVRATQLAALFEEAISLFPGGEPARDIEGRRVQLLESGGLGEDGREGLLGELTEMYYRLQADSPEHCLYQRLTAFALKQLAKRA